MPMEMPTTVPVEMPVWNWMPSIADTTEMAGVSTPAEVVVGKAKGKAGFAGKGKGG